MINEKCPRAGGTACAGEYQGAFGPDYPLCGLHRQAVVDELPTGCPLVQAESGAALQALQDSAWRLLAPGPGQDVAGGLWGLRRYETCFGCEARRHPWVQRLRMLAQGARVAQRAQRAQPEPLSPVPPNEPRPAGLVPIHARRVPTRGKAGAR